MPFSLGGETPIWSSPLFAHSFADAFMDPHAKRMTTPALPIEESGKEKEKENKTGEKIQPNMTCFPLLPAIEFVSKKLNK
jgi:hypothetical protein